MPVQLLCRCAGRSQPAHHASSRGPSNALSTYIQAQTGVVGPMTAPVCALLKVFGEGVRGNSLSSERGSPAKAVLSAIAARVQRRRMPLQLLYCCCVASG